MPNPVFIYNFRITIWNQPTTFGLALTKHFWYFTFDTSMYIPTLQSLGFAYFYVYIFKFLNMNYNHYLCERTCKPPEASKTTALQVMKLLLACVFTGNHVLYDPLYSIQDHMVMADWEHTVYLGIQETVTTIHTWKHFNSSKNSNIRSWVTYEQSHYIHILIFQYECQLVS